MKNIFATSLATLLLVGCGSTEPTEPQPQVRPVASIEVTPRVLSLTVGEEATLSAVARDVDGNPVSANIQWRSDKPHVAAVSGEGVVSGVSTCDAQVWALDGGVASDRVQVTVESASPNSAESAACGG